MGEQARFAQQPKPLEAIAAEEGFIGEATNKLPLNECVRRVKLTDCLMPRQRKPVRK
jgi:hypothetical protein